MIDSRFKQFFSAVFFTTLFPFLSYIFPFLPRQIFGFTVTGWAWICMLLVTFIHLLRCPVITLPVWTWIPWMVYLIGYIVFDFSFLGLQLTLQYLLPILIGCVASSFIFSEEKLDWLFKWFTRLCMTVTGMFAIGYLFRGGYTPAAAATPMLLSIAASLLIGLYFITGKSKYLIYFGLFFLVPVIDVTRMAIAVFLVILVFHFANRRIAGKIIFGFLGLALLILVFHSDSFQKKTFYSGRGNITDVTFNYYDNTILNNNGRTSWKMALEPGLKKEPLWGNGPRADIFALYRISNNQNGEAHNDYLSVRYNYGYVGLVLLLFGFTATFLDIYRRLKRKNELFDCLLGTSILTLFVSFLMFMYSDNILKYTIYFPNLFFALVGIFYSMDKYGLEQYQNPVLEIPDSI